MNLKFLAIFSVVLFGIASVAGHRYISLSRFCFFQQIFLSRSFLSIFSTLNYKYFFADYSCDEKHVQKPQDPNKFCHDFCTKLSTFFENGYCKDNGNGLNCTCQTIDIQPPRYG